MFVLIAEIMGWIATIFRGAGMLAHGMMVKYLVSIGNLFWFINGAMTSNTPLMVSNGFCLIVMLYEMYRERFLSYIFHTIMDKIISLWEDAYKMAERKKKVKETKTELIEE